MVLAFLKRLWKQLTKPDLERHLEGAQDIYELERRIQKLNYCKRYY